jgi:hypothetical protein
MKSIHLSLLLMLAAAPPSAAATGSCSGWTQLQSPNTGSNDNVLAAIAANSAADIWAVGQIAPDSDPNLTQTLIQHYDGSAWSVVVSPNVGSKANALLSVTANSGLAWAAGYYFDANAHTRSLIEVWDGSAWSVVQHPQPGVLDLLFAISALTPADIWAVGAQRQPSGVYVTLTEHFDGSAWSVVPSPSPGTTGNWLFAVQAIASDNVWAVGQKYGGGGPDQALIEHWDGSRWSVSAAPMAGSYSTLLYGITGTSDGEVWAAGDAENDQTSPATLVELRANNRWAINSTKSLSPGENHLYGITAARGGPVWAVGAYAPTVNGNLSSLIQRWDGQAWVQENTPNPGQANGSTMVAGVAAVSASDVWAVGAYDGPNALQTLVLHRCQ